MSNFNWIESAGGPLILISDNNVKYWSGILNREQFLREKELEASDALDADETDYGRACLINDFLGLIDIGNDRVLILGDEPLITTSFFSADEKYTLARLYYGEDIALIENQLQELELTTINDWQEPIEFELSSSIQYLFDSALSYLDLNKENTDVSKLNIKEGRYTIWTSIYEPNNETKVILHKFEKTS